MKQAKENTSMIDSPPRQTVSNPEPHSLLIVSAGVHIGTPDFNATWRERYAASNEEDKTLPTKVSSTFSALNPACANAATELCT